MTTGYNSHGYWSTLGHMREIELERENPFPDISYPDDTPAIWICKTRREAVRYLLPSERWDEEPTEDELEEVQEIDLPDESIIIASDGDGGFLVISPSVRLS